jgi:hypothetical protein
VAETSLFKPSTGRIQYNLSLPKWTGGHTGREHPESIRQGDTPSSKDYT